MYSYLEIEDRSFEDLYMKYCGMEECAPNYTYGPAIRDNYLIHFCLAGKGKYHCNNKSYEINKGDVFLIMPGDVTFYQADEDDPWTYAWIGFDGKKAELYLKRCNLGEEGLVSHVGDVDDIRKTVIEILAHYKLSYSNEMYIQGKLFLLLSNLAKFSNIPYNSEGENDNAYVQKAIEYIQNNYQNDVAIQSIADFIGLNRSYLSTLFKKHIKQTPQEFLKHYRLFQAKDFLINTELPINYISYSCGYGSHMSFSKAFRSYFGMGPREYRKIHGLDKSKIKIGFDQKANKNNKSRH